MLSGVRGTLGQPAVAAQVGRDAGVDHRDPDHAALAGRRGGRRTTRPAARGEGDRLGAADPLGDRGQRGQVVGPGRDLLRRAGVDHPVHLGRGHRPLAHAQVRARLARRPGLRLEVAQQVASPAGASAAGSTTSPRATRHNRPSRRAARLDLRAPAVGAAASDQDAQQQVVGGRPAVPQLADLLLQDGAQPGRCRRDRRILGNRPRRRNPAGLSRTSSRFLSCAEVGLLAELEETATDLVIHARRVHDGAVADPRRFGPIAADLVRQTRRSGPPEALALALRAAAWVAARPVRRGRGEAAARRGGRGGSPAPAGRRRWPTC